MRTSDPFSVYQDLKSSNGNDIKSLYINPQKKEKNPMSNSMYLILYSDFSPSIFSPNQHTKEAMKNRMRPCPMSPNITPNKNGKVTILNTFGLISLYHGIPYVSTVDWNCDVNSFNSK